MTDFGTITADGTTRTLRFERLLEHPPHEVWAALTDPGRLGEWRAPASVRPGEGGEITLDFGEEGVEHSRITIWDPPRLLAYESSSVGESPSLVRWELAVLDEGSATRLTLEHTLLEPGTASECGAGWHAHLDQLEGHLEGHAGPWQERCEAVLPRYREAAAGVA
jgi:uncharacterized protein YndB with AHSA1/START domain